MWTIYGIDSPQVENVQKPKHIIVGDFKETSHISIADFNNASYDFLYISGDRTAPLVPVQTNMSQYVNYSGTNLLAYNRFNILHRDAPEGTHIVEYKYDGCAYTWTFTTPGGDYYALNGYLKNELMFSHVPQDIFNGPNEDVPKSLILSCRLVATTNENGGIGVVRELWCADFTGYLSRYPVQWWLGKVVNNSCIQEWVDKPNEKIDENKPNKPTTKDPEDADQHSATTAGFTWENKFKIMNWPASAPWPSHMLIDLKYRDPSSPDYVPFQSYMAYNDSNDPQNLYHNSTPLYDHYLESMQAIQLNINNDISEVGSDFTKFDSIDSEHGKFITYNPTIDGAANYTVMRLGEIEIGEITIDNTHPVGGLTQQFVDRYRFYTGNNYFALNNNYTNSWGWIGTLDLSSTIGSFLAVNIIRYQNNYYLGGVFIYSRAYIGLCILCRITNLKTLPGFDDGEQGDPKTPTDPTTDPNGINPQAIDNTFGDGTGLEPNPTTDSKVNDQLGDAPDEDNDGSAYNPDGTPRNPADYDTPGTGEKNTNPVDSHVIPNTHDGSVGNGTGDIHEGDTVINVTQLPSGTTSPGTVGGAGMLTVFTPSQAELNTFSAELLSPTAMNAIKNFFTTNPMDGIFGLHMLPYTGFSGSATAFPCIGTHVFTSALTLAEHEYIEVDYGTVSIPFAYDGYENYAPYSDAKLFLPFLGTKDVDINVVQGCICQLLYRISLVTGDIYAYMYCTWESKWGEAGTPQGNSHLLYSWQGNCAATIPLSHLDSTNYISGAMQVAGGITALAAGAANPIAIPAGLAGITKGVAEVGRTSIITSGNISGVSAFMGCHTPYFILSRPIMAWNANYNHYVGQRANAIEKIGNLSDGTFTVMRNIDLKGVPATSEEISEISSIMQGGFYI